MSALGHEQTSRDVRVMSALPPIADIRQRGGMSAKCYYQTRSLVPNRIDYATWASWSGGGRCPHEVGECVGSAGDA